MPTTLMRKWPWRWCQTKLRSDILLISKETTCMVLGFYWHGNRNVVYLLALPYSSLENEFSIWNCQFLIRIISPTLLEASWPSSFIHCENCTWITSYCKMSIAKFNFCGDWPFPLLWRCLGWRRVHLSVLLGFLDMVQVLELQKGKFFLHSLWSVTPYGLACFIYIYIYYEFVRQFDWRKIITLPLTIWQGIRRASLQSMSVNGNIITAVTCFICPVNVDAHSQSANRQCCFSRKFRGFPWYMHATASSSRQFLTYWMNLVWQFIFKNRFWGAKLHNNSFRTRTN